MKKNLKKLIDKNREKLNIMIKEKKPYNDILQQSELIDDYINEFYKKKKAK